jgi:hypothetical protein
MFHIYFPSVKVSCTKSTARLITSEELAAAGVPPTEQNAPLVQMIQLPKPFAIPGVVKMER